MSQPEDKISSLERQLTLADFDYPYPEPLVAQQPGSERHQSRLLVHFPDGRVKHSQVLDLTTELPVDTLLILNDTKVFPSRVLGRLGTGGEVELFLLDQFAKSGFSGQSTWRALGRPLKKLKPGTLVHLGNGVDARVDAKTEDGAGTAFVELTFNKGTTDFAAWLDKHGYIPLPPYIKREDPSPAAQSLDRDRYQTVYAAARGSVAAPTAGLHFSDDLLGRLAARGVEIRRVCLHVGAGTFLPVKTEDISRHKMHAERYQVGRSTMEALLAARRAKRPVVAIGTTSLRSLEDLYRRANGSEDEMLRLADDWHATELFIRPRVASDRYKPWVIDGLLTNFHQPCSTLFMLVSSLLGLEEAKSLYREAIRQQYRLFSYGDASLLWL